MLRLLSQPDVPRLGYVRVGAVANHLASVINGEPTEDGQSQVRYGFGIGSEFIELTRLVGDETQTLAYVDISLPTQPAFRAPELTSTIDDPAKIAELTQLFAIGQDAAEWALD